MTINDYSGGYDSIIEEMKPYTISYTQKEAGFEVQGLSYKHVKEFWMRIATPNKVDEPISKLYEWKGINLRVS